MTSFERLFLVTISRCNKTFLLRIKMFSDVCAFETLGHIKLYFIMHMLCFKSHLTTLKTCIQRLIITMILLKITVHKISFVFHNNTSNLKNVSLSHTSTRVVFFVHTPLCTNCVHLTWRHITFSHRHTCVCTYVFAHKNL